MQQDPYRDAESLFRAFYRGVVGLAYSQAGNKPDAEDIAQESFCNLLSAWARVVILPTAGRQRAYLTTIVIHESLRVLEDPYRKRTSAGADIGEREALEEPTDAKVQARDQLRFTWEAIAGLPEMRRAVIGLYTAGHEYEEIAAWLGISVSADGWVKVCLEEDGQERVITERGPGDLVGERGTVPGGVRSATVLARDEVQALVMKTADYMAFVTEYPGVPDLVKEQTYDRSTGRADRP